MCTILISKALRLARVNEGSHGLPVTHTYGMSQPQSIVAVAVLWPGLVSRPAEGRRLS